MLDLIIIGAGPAGLSACLYASRAGLDVLIFDSAAPGGKLNVTAQIENYPGLKPTPGPEIAFTMYESALSFGAKMEYGEVLDIKDYGDYKEVITAQQTYQTKYVLIATGTKERQMNLEKENELVGRGISYCAVCDGPFFKNQEVAVIGGGNSALEEAMYLATLCKKVHLIVRRDVFRADKIIQDRLLKSENIEVHFKRKPAEILEEDNKVKGLTTDDGAEYEFDVVVDCTGPWSKITGEMVGLNVPIWHTKAEAFFLCPPGKKLDYTFPVLKYPEFYALRAGDNIFICKSHLSMDLNNPMHAGQWDPDKLPATGGTDDYFIDFLLDQLDAKVPGIVDSGLVSSWLSYRAEPKDFWPVLGKTPVEGYMLSTGFGGNGVIEVPAATRDLAKLIMRDESTPLLENWAFERLLED